MFLYDRRLLSQEAATPPPAMALTPVHAKRKEFSVIAFSVIYADSDFCYDVNVEVPSQPVASSEGSKMLRRVRIR